MILEIKNLTKKYNKQKTGLSNFSMTMEKGVLGLLGPNGAGKSTLMKIISTISKPTHGTIFLNGEDIVKNPDTIRKILGYLPQDFGVYPNLNAYEFLEYIAAMKGVGGSGLRKRIDMLLDGVNLTAAAKQPIGSYSGGMKQRIGIAQTLLNDPKILIFDEPTVGLDPEERVRFRQLISEMASDAIIILSSHIVSDIESIADEVAIMKTGTLIGKAIPSEIIKRIENKVFETVISNADLPAFKAKHLVIDTSRQGDKTQLRYISGFQEIEAGARNVPAGLEDAYLFLTQN
ncbi:ABC-type multidrug transport system, ATPase component [Pedobacter steynii]|uniref:ABC-type multidrug transport system, ATPase component n=1 Tax=Pedobacter steynii TaxID=430522 RepID=A0A1H0J688_9SPHI|nr:ABC transporter ATP-binding protein [Pedobacter steynii]NQX43044.1 ABC transporter ATP-binding protein [Pedobacter steynii]SDO39246.1 ABC-type multidrug transport system, ATPase component [Pedobacter steynii]